MTSAKAVAIFFYNNDTWQWIVQKSELRLHAFGRACHLIVDNDDGRGLELLSQCRHELIRLEEKFSFYCTDSVSSQINQAAGTGCSVHLDAEARSLFLYIEALWDASKHLFDPTTRVLQDCYDSNGTLIASRDQLNSMLKLVGWKSVEISSEGARLTHKGMLVNLNSCVRPYVLDTLRKLLLRQEVKHAYIELDQDVATIGKQPDGANWLVGVRIPKGSRAAIVRLKVNQQGFAVRGDFEHAVLHNGEYFGRALSPVDGQPIPGLLSVAVVADNCLTACTAANVARLKTEASGIKWLENLGLPWMAVDRRMNCIGPLAPVS